MKARLQLPFLLMLVPLAWQFAIAGEIARDEKTIGSKIEEIETELANIRNEIQRIKAEEGKIAGWEIDLLAEIEQINQRIAANERLLRTLKLKKQAIAEDLEIKRQEMEAAEISYGEACDQLCRRLRAIYKFGRGTIMGVLVASSTFSQLAKRMYYLSIIAEHDSRLVKRFEERMELQRVLLKHVEDRKKTMEDVEHQIIDQNRNLKLIRSERDALLASLKEKRAYYEFRSKELSESSRYLEELISGFGESRSEFTPRHTFAAKRGRLIWPCQGEVVGYFGVETHPKFGTIIKNNGIDIKSIPGSHVRAVAEGTISFAGDVSGLGNTVIIAHGDGFYSLYGRLESIMVKESTEVLEAQVIGTIGEMSSYEGAVLHFEIRKGKSALDPLTWLLK